MQQRFYDIDIDADLHWSNESFGENYHDSKCVTGDVVLLGGVGVDAHRWLQWHAMEGSILLTEGSTLHPIVDASLTLRFDGIPLQAACFVNSLATQYSATMTIATTTSIITISMQGDANTSLLSSMVDFNQGSTIVLHAPGLIHDYSHFLRLYSLPFESSLSAAIQVDSVVYSTSNGDLIRCTVENNALECRSLREAGLTSLYGLFSAPASPTIAIEQLSTSDTVTVNALGLMSLPSGSVTLAQLWGVSARDPWVSNVTLAKEDALLRVDASEEVVLAGLRLVYRGQVVQVNISTGIVTPLSLPFPDAALLDICCHNDAIISLWQAANIFIVRHSTPTSFVLFKTRDEYAQAMRREDETLFRAISVGSITDMTHAKNLWCRRLMLPHRFINSAFHPSQLSSYTTLSALNEACLELMTLMHENEAALPLRLVMVGDIIFTVRPGGASCLFSAQSTDAALNMAIPMSETLMEMDIIMSKTIWAKHAVNKNDIENILTWCRGKSTANNPGANFVSMLNELSVLPDLSHIPTPLHSQVLRHIIKQYYAVAKVICLYVADTPHAYQAITTALYYFILLTLGELRTNVQHQLRDVEYTDLLLLDATACGVPKDASPLWKQIMLNTSGNYHNISVHNSIVAYLAKHGPYSMLTRILSLFTIMLPPMTPPLSSSYQQHVTLLMNYFDHHIVEKSLHMANFQIAMLSHTNIEDAAYQLLEDIPCPPLEEHGEAARSDIEGDIAAIIADDVEHWYGQQSSKYAMYRMLLKLAQQPLFQQYYASYYHTTSTLQYMITYTPSLILRCASVYQKLNTLFLLHRSAIRVSHVYALECCYHTLSYLDRMPVELPAILDIYSSVHSHVVTYCLENNKYSNCWTSIIALIDLHREKNVDNNWQMMLKSFLHQICKHNVAWLCSLHADPSGLPGYLHTIIGDELEKLAYSLDIPRCVLYYDSLVAYWVSCAEYREVARIMYQLAGRLRSEDNAELLKRCLVTATAALSLLPPAQQFIVLRQQDVSIENQQRQLQAVHIKDLRYEYILTLCREHCSVYYEHDVDIMQQLCSHNQFLLALQLQTVSKQEQDCKRVLMHHLSRHMVTVDATPVQQFLSVIPPGILFRHVQNDYSNVLRIIVHLLQSKEYRYDCVEEVFRVLINSPARNELSSELVQFFCGVQDGEAKYCGSNLQILLLLLLKAGRLTEACNIAANIIYAVPANQHNTIPFHVIDQLLFAAASVTGKDRETNEMRTAADALKEAVKNYFASLCLVESYDTSTSTL